MVMVLEPQHLLRVRLWLCNRSVYDIPSMKCFCKSCIPASLFQNLLVILAMVFVQYFQSRNGDEPLSLPPSPSLYISAGELNGCNILPLTWKHRSHPGNDGHFRPRLAKSFHKDYILFLDPIDPESLWLWSHPVLTIFYSELVFNNQSFFPWYLRM